MYTENHEFLDLFICSCRNFSYIYFYFKDIVYGTCTFTFMLFGSPLVFFIDSPGWIPDGIFIFVSPLLDSIVLMHPNTASNISITISCWRLSNPQLFAFFFPFFVSFSANKCIEIIKSPNIPLLLC